MNANNFLKITNEASKGRKLKGRRKKIYILVGPPSVGKTTWIKNNVPNAYVISRDEIAEKVAAANGWTYDDLFVGPPADAELGSEDPKYGKVIKSPDYMTWQPISFEKVFKANSQVQKMFTDKVKGAVDSRKDIVVDMTNMNINARAGALQAIKGFEKDFLKIAVVFKFEGMEGLIKTVATKRAEAAKRMGKSKTIPAAAFDRMFKSYQKVGKREGFDKIINADTKSGLEKSLQTEFSQIKETILKLKSIK